MTSDPCEKEQKAFDDAIEELIQAEEIQDIDIIKIRKLVLQEDYNPEIDPLISASEKLKETTFALKKCRELNN